MMHRPTYRLMLLLVVALFATLGEVRAAVVGHDATAVAATDSHDPWYGVIEQWHASSPMAPSEVSSSHSVAPAMRTMVRGNRNVEPMLRLAAATRSIDSTVAASRQGLYNHKILFVSLARLHYLNRLMRLRI